MYCGINEAWGFDFNSETTINNNNNNNSDDYNKYLNLKERFENNVDTNKEKICSAVEEHCKNCIFCKSRMMKDSLSGSFQDIIEKFKDLLESILSNKDLVTLILVCILILLILKLFNK